MIDSSSSGFFSEFINYSTQGIDSSSSSDFFSEFINYSTHRGFFEKKLKVTSTKIKFLMFLIFENIYIGFTYKIFTKIHYHPFISSSDFFSEFIN